MLRKTSESNYINVKLNIAAAVPLSLVEPSTSVRICSLLANDKWKRIHVT